MDERISALTERKIQQRRRQRSEEQHELTTRVDRSRENSDADTDVDEFQVTHPTTDLETNYAEAAYGFFPEFTETPLEDLLAVYPQEPLVYDFGSSIRRTSATSNYLPAGVPETQEEIWPLPPDFEHPFTTSIQNTSRLVTANKSRSYSKFSTSSLKRRLSQYSSLYLKAIEDLLRTHSVSGASNGSFTASCCHTNSASFTDDNSTTDNSTLRAIPLPRPSRSRAARVILPDALLVLDEHIRRQGICLPGFKTHDSRSCWCLAELDPETELWVHKNGLVAPHFSDPPTGLGSLDLVFKDTFGNTALHMLAARGAHESVILTALKFGVDGNAKNAGGQTFLHVFPPKFFEMLEKSVSVRKAFVQGVSSFNVKFHECDPFGRNFFHLLTRHASEFGSDILPVCDTEYQLLPTRDVFGWVASFSMSSPQIDHMAKGTCLLLINSQWSRVVYYRFTNDERDHRSANGSGSDQGSSKGIPQWDPAYPSKLTEKGAMIYKHARILKTAWISIDVPSIQDSYGRNGLQCLAEASLDLDVGGRESNSNKRKRGQSNVDASPTGMRLRYQLAKEMIGLGVDVNNYDEEGSTVLMTFVTHLSDGDDNRTIADIFDLLINSGANIHRRNRQDETALHIAVRLGRKVATRILLAKGANVHARTAEEKGVLATREKHYLKARDNPPLYASIIACMALCRGYQAVAAPTWVQEWSVRKDGFI